MNKVNNIIEEVEVSDEEYQQQQHEDLLEVLTKILNIIKNDSSKDERLAELISKSNVSFDVFLTKLRELSAPQVILNNDNSEAIKIGTELKEKIDEMINLQRESNELRKLPVKMTPKRGGFQGTGLIESVTVESQFPNKSKYQA